MVIETRWIAWDEQIAVQVTEGAALGTAVGLVRAVIDEAEAACSLHRGDAEIHAVNLAQGVPVQVSAVLGRLLRSALWVARMTDGAVSPLATAPAPAGVPTVHPDATVTDIRIDDATVLAPYGVSFDIDATAKPDAADRAAASAAGALECGVLVRIGSVVATAGHCPAGGWHVPIPGDRTIELPTGCALATVEADGADSECAHLGGNWRQVTVMASEALWAYGGAAAAARRGVGAVSWLEQQELAARLVDRGGRVYTTDEWRHPHAA